MNELRTLRWVLDQPGILMVVGKNKTVTLTYGHCFEITATSLVAAVRDIQNAQIAKDAALQQTLHCPPS